VSLAQRAWLAGWLPTVADRPAVLFVHHPPTDEDGDLLDGDRLLALLRANAHVKAVFHGHAHVWALGRLDGRHLVSLPAVGYSFSDAQPVGWVDARFRSDGATLTLRAVAGNRAELAGLNTVGMQRAGLNEEQIGRVKEAYRVVFRSGLALKEALAQLQSSLGSHPEIAHFLRFFQGSERGITR